MPVDALQKIAIDRKAAVPLYHQIFLQLRDEIISGVRPLGALVPTEQELSERFGVSRITARHALHELAEQRFVARKRRVGTQVIYTAPVRSIEGNIDKAIATLVTFGQETKVTVVEIAKEDIQEPNASLLGVDVGTRVVRVIRIRWLDDEPLGCTIAYVPEEFAFVIKAKMLKNSPLLTLIKQTGREIGSAHQMIAAVRADPAMAASLQIDAMEPLLRITRCFHDEDNRPLLLTRAFYRADRYQVRADLATNSLRPEIA